MIVCDGGWSDKCTFADLVELIRVLFNDAVLLSTLVVVILFIYAGFILLTSGGNTAKWTQAKGILWNILLGYIWILVAWVIVYTISKALLFSEFTFLKP